MSNLFDPIQIGALTLPNRLVMSPLTRCRAGKERVPTALMAEYYTQRATAGLIISEAARVHETALSDSPAINASTDACVEAYARLADAVQQHGCRLFGQVSHSGRANDRKRDGLRDVAYSASAVPDERFHNMPRAMSVDLIAEVIAAYAAAAKRMATAGLDGIEIPASHGLLPEIGRAHV